MRARNRPFLHAFVLSCLFCAVAVAAPAVQVTTDRSEDAASVFAGSPIDLLVKVAPGGEGVRLESLAVTAEPGGQAAVAAAILPPPDGEGVYREPFVARIPMTVAASGKAEFPVAVAGRTAAGDAFRVEATAKFRAESTKGGQVSATAALKAPAKAGAPNAVVVSLSVIEGYHVYGKEVQYGLPFTAELLPAGPERLWTGGARVTPPGDEVHGEFTVEIPFTPAKEGRVETRVALFWQACTPELCEPNEVAYLPIAFDVAKGSGDAAVAAVEPAEKDDLGSKGLWQLILLSIGGALFALAMPCTYPLIPITISFFTKQAETRHRNVAPLAFAYGGGIVAMFAGIGLLVGTAAFSADNVLDFATNRWVNGVFAALFVLFGLSLIGLFDIRLPGWFDDVAAKAGSGGGFLGVFAMGATLVITSFTCTAPIVGALLVWVGKSGDWTKATLAMGVFGLTMAAPFVALSLSPKALQQLPKSGAWMKHLKVTLGILEIGLALKFLSGVDLAIETYLIDRELFLVLWGASFVAAGLYLVGAFSLFRGGIGAGRGAAAILLLALAGYLGSGISGKRLWQKLEAFLPPFSRLAQHYDKAFAAVVVDDYEKGVQVARADGWPILLHFTGFQ